MKLTAYEQLKATRSFLTHNNYDVDFDPKRDLDSFELYFEDLCIGVSAGEHEVEIMVSRIEDERDSDTLLLITTVQEESQSRRTGNATLNTLMALLKVFKAGEVA